MTILRAAGIAGCEQPHPILVIQVRQSGDLLDTMLRGAWNDGKQRLKEFRVIRDMFLSDTARTHRKLRAAGVVADLHVYEGVAHADYLILVDSPESKDMFQEVGDFFKKHLE